MNAEETKNKYDIIRKSQLSIGKHTGLGILIGVLMAIGLILYKYLSGKLL